jgi:hypothetical protein
MMILWSSNRTGHANIFYRLYGYSPGVKPYPTSNPVQITFNNTYDRIRLWENKGPVAIQDRLGRIWLSWAAEDFLKADGCKPAICADVYYKYFNGTSWSKDFAVPVASNPTLSEHSPAIAQAKDGRIWTVFSSNDTKNSNLYYTTIDGTITTLPATGIPAASWAPKKSFFTDTTNEVDSPSFIQARDGTFWLFFQLSPPAVPRSNIYLTSSTDNGVTWALPVASTSAPYSDSTPSGVQVGYPDNRIWLFWDRVGTFQLEVWYTQSDPVTNIRDVGIKTVGIPVRLVRNYYPVNVSIVVSNYGDSVENPNLTFLLNGINKTSVRVANLNQGETRLVWVNWTSPQGFWGRYNLTIILQPAPGENPINLGDNSVAAGLVRISPPGDVNGDGRVDILDASALAVAFDSRRGDPKYNPYADINRDGVIDILDASALAYNFDRSV